MSDTHFLTDARELIAGYDPLDLAAKIGGLQLIPENADRMTRFEAASTIAACLRPPSIWVPKIPKNRLSEWINGPFVPQFPYLSEDDPFTGLFTESFSFDGGPFIVFSGILENATFLLRCMRDAILLQPPIGLTNQNCRTEAHKLITAVLALSDIIARRAGLGRNVLPVAAMHEPVGIPLTDRLEFLANAVRFASNDLRRLLGAAYNSLAPLIATLGQHALEDVNPHNLLTLAAPIVRSGDEIVIVAPGHLLAALRHHLICLLLRHNQLDAFNTGFRWCVFRTVVRSLNMLGNQAIGALLPPIDDALPMQDQLFSLDRDKVMHCILITDELDGYDPEVVFGDWQATQIGNALERRIRQIDEIVYSQKKPPNELFHLILFQGLGRNQYMTLPDPVAPANSLQLTMSAASLEIISALEGNNELLLWQFAHANERFAERTNTVASCDLDKFALYREHGHSFYFTDSAAPNFLWIPPGGGGRLEQEAKLRLDLHAVVKFRSDSLVEVFRVESDVPIYAIFPTPGVRGGIALLVEAFDLPVWIVAPDVIQDDRFRDIYFRLVEMVAFWIWQFAPALDDMFNVLADRGIGEFIIMINAVSGEAWFADNVSTDLHDKCDCEPHPPNEVHLQIGPGFSRGFSCPDNSAERIVVRKVLQSIANLFAGSTGESASLTDPDVLDSTVDRYAPLGRKKKLLSYNSAANPRLVRTGLPPFRKVQEAETQELTDDIGTFLNRDLKLRVGLVEDGQRHKVLNDVVAFLYRKLEHLIATLSPIGLLEALVLSNERIVYEDAFSKIAMPTRIACYSSVSEMVETHVEEYQGRSIAHVASRFLIEYVTARPPNGLRPYSLAVYDRLLAIAAEIIKYADISDAFKYNLTNRPFELLESGRLAIGRSPYEDAQDEFMTEFSFGQVGQSLEVFDRHWPADATTAEPETHENEFRSAVNEATRFEFGMALSELIEFLVAAFRIGEAIDDEPKSVELSQFLAQLGESLKWSNKQLVAAFDLLAAYPRRSFLKPPDTYAPHHVFPWRHGRPLSYFRRPFLVRRNESGQEVIWGNRQLTLAMQAWQHACYGGHVDARTPEMRQLQGEIHNRDGEVFNNRVAELFESQAHLVVKRRVTKVGNLKLQRDNGESLGDIDVLVADGSQRLVLVVETKDLSVSFTPYEVEKELKHLYGDGKKAVGKLDIHLERTKWIQDNLRELLKWLKLSGEFSSWTVQPIAVFDRELYSPYIARKSIQILSYRRLAERLIAN